MIISFSIRIIKKFIFVLCFTTLIACNDVGCNDYIQEKVKLDDGSHYYLIHSKYCIKMKDKMFKDVNKKSDYMKMVIDAYCELCMLEEDVMYMDKVSNLNIAKYRLVAEHGCESGDLKYADPESRSLYYSMDKLWDTSIRGYNINKVMGSDGIVRKKGIN